MDTERKSIQEIGRGALIKNHFKPEFPRPACMFGHITSARGVQG